MKKFRKYTIMFLLLISLVFIEIIQIEAEEQRISTSFPKTVKVTAGISEIHHYAYIQRKEYTSSLTSGKALCTSMRKQAGNVSCDAIKWNSNDTKNKKIAVAIAAMINKMRSLSGSGASITWENYFYGEFAINDFLYNYNGKEKVNQNDGFFTSASLSSIRATATYKKILAAGTLAYENYGKTSVDLSNATITISNENKTVTVSAKVTCKKNNKIVACNLSKKTITITGTSSNGSAVKEIITNPKVAKNNNILTLKYDKTYSEAFKDETNVTVNFSVKNKNSYGVAQNYDCKKNQDVTINSVKSISLYDEDSISKKVKTGNTTVDCSLPLKKIESGTSNNIPNAKFALYEYDEETQKYEKISTKTTNSKGELTFTNISVPKDGKKYKYGYQEIQVPSDYILDNKTYEISINVVNNNCIVSGDNVDSGTIKVKNDHVTGNLVISKVDNEEKNVSGAKIKVFTVNSDIINSDDEDTNGEGTDVNLPDVSEEETDEEYIETLDEGNYSYLYFDSNGNYMPGITDDNNGQYFNYFVTGDSPKTIEGLTVGQTYYVVEEAVPENTDYAFNVSSEVIKIEANQTHEVKLINIHSSFYISKQDITTKKELPGAELKILDSRGIATVYKWTSSDKPQEITGLADGDYTLVETTAPDGYKVSESIPFTIENGKLKDDEDNTLVMYDSVVVNVPDTFTTRNIITMIIGLALVISGTGVLVYEIKKKKTA